MPKTQQWSGEKLNPGQKLLVVSEQGLGDTIQFMRYIPYLQKQSVDVSFCAQTKLHGLIQSSNIHPNPLTPEQANLIQEGKWIPLLSLPKYLEVNPQNPIISKSYISTTDSFINKWKEILSHENQPIIGINWQGNPDAEKNNLKGRSIPLELFSTIAKHNDCKFLSLQKGFGSEQLENCSFRDKFVGCQQQIDSTWDFLENAAIIANCDLIITSDTSIAHLAGAIGKQTWLLLHNVPDWRWGMTGDTTFWYPSMKLFRQEARNEWHILMEKVAIALKAIIKK